MDLSVVIPIKDERDNLRPLHDKLRQALDPTGLQYEIVLVDDGSTDGSTEVMETLAATDSHLKVVCLRRNYGQSAAMQAGIDFASGDVFVTMDGDLQNDPADIPHLLEKLQEGYDAVFGLRANRQDHFLIRKAPSHVANWLIRKVTGVQIKDMGCTLRAIRREFAKELPLYGEMHRFIPVLIQHHGGRMVQVPVNHHPRVAGKTKYNLTRTFRVLLDLVTVKFMHSYLTRPMHVMGMLGMISMGLGFVVLMITLWQRFLTTPYTDMTGNPLFLLSALLEIVGVQFISLGLIGEVLTRTYFESQGKRAYTVRNTYNLDPLERRKAA